MRTVVLIEELAVWRAWHDWGSAPHLSRASSRRRPAHGRLRIVTATQTNEHGPRHAGHLYSVRHPSLLINGGVFSVKITSFLSP